jgi:transcriptional regulator with PAS, ATPase and Fis domain
MRELARAARGVAQRNATVMLTGETGTGKELVARYIHTHSGRADQPFVPVDCAAMTEGLFESQLFGHARGAFTSAIRDSLGFIRAADGGTLFLDEIGELPLSMQAKLLRVLQERRVTAVGDVRARAVNIRVISATHRDLAEMVKCGEFRQDLYYRLNVVPLEVPPLRHRPADILPLAQHFLAMQADVYGESPKRLSAETCEMLLHHRWPGNVRELANAMERAFVMAAGDEILPSDLPDVLRQDAGAAADAEFDLRAIERHTILKALRRTRNNKTAACRLLGINVQRLTRRIKHLGIRL